MKLQSFQFDVSDVIPANVENILPLPFFAFLFADFIRNRSRAAASKRKIIIQSFIVFLTIFPELMKL